MRQESFPGTVVRGPADAELLRAVRDLVAADRAMRLTMAARMNLGETDMRAVRYVMARALAGRPATPRQVADHLGISTAATTTLLDRLVSAGHVQRQPHPADRRSKVVVPTGHSWEETQRELAPVHDRMRAVAAAVPESDHAAIIAFLRDLTEVMEDSTD